MFTQLLSVGALRTLGQRGDSGHWLSQLDPKRGACYTSNAPPLPREQTPRIAHPWLLSVNGSNENTEKNKGETTNQKFQTALNTSELKQSSLFI